MLERAGFRGLPKSIRPLDDDKLEWRHSEIRKATQVHVLRLTGNGLLLPLSLERRFPVLWADLLRITFGEFIYAGFFGRFIHHRVPQR